ncbi:restriction endonuclease subunit S [Shewanella sp. SG44-2]|uniref:restriction endonuclease subunit S n=1 Tax=Shewanella sp. SG44-2 TaxID=2760962 RepID=UPI001600D447|nr:restriction endonuclease subunit S [Shewanella sp. SG44-2]MBB1426371.1 restriction endonuclease subunit S [Shewanella sp. SG44-2]
MAKPLELKTESTNPQSIITNHIDIWASAIEQKSSAGRGTSNKFSLYGIKKLRELILELAVRGKLVPQDANDEPASVLLDRIATEKAQLVKEGKLKKQKPLPELGDDEKPFELPNGWVWVRLNEAAEYNGRPNLDPNNITGNTWLLDLEDIEKDSSRLLYKAVYSERESKSNKSTFQKGDVLYGKLRPYLNKVIIADDDGVCTTEIVPIVPNEAVNAEYLKYLLKSPSFLNYVNSLMYGVKMPRLGTDDAIKSIHPIAPLKEQLRIVAKVDELMSLCDALEAQTEASISAHQTLVETLLKSLIADTSGKTAMDGGNVENAGAIFDRIAEHFDTLFTTEASIDTLKQTILQLAVMGKLVSQDKNEEPAAKLLKRIAKEKAQLISDGKIKKQKPLQAIIDEEKPFELPKGWEWDKCQNICFKITDGEHATPERAESGHYLLSARNVTNEGIILNDVDYVPTHEFNRIRKRCDPNIGDILISCSGSIGRVALVDRDNTYCMVRSAAMIRPCNENLSPLFLAIMLRSPYLQDQMSARSKQLAQANLFLGAIGNLVAVIPPLEEQKRIVAKVDELMTLCDQLKSCLSDTQTTKLNLTDAILVQAVS